MSGDATVGDGVHPGLLPALTDAFHLDKKRIHTGFWEMWPPFGPSLPFYHSRMSLTVYTKLLLGSSHNSVGRKWVGWDDSMWRNLHLLARRVSSVMGGAYPWNGSPAVAAAIALPLWLRVLRIYLLHTSHLEQRGCNCVILQIKLTSDKFRLSRAVCEKSESED